MHTTPRPAPSTVPLIGMLVGATCLGFAAIRYPGGYDWWHQSISSLFQPLARDGSQNGSRWLAAAGIIVCCASLGLVFHELSRRGPTASHRRLIQIGGVGSMVYAALAVTPMHDLMVWIALAFFVVAMVTIFHWLHIEGRHRLMVAGFVCLSLTLSNAVIYRFGVFTGLLPVVQKLGTVSWVVWLLVFHRQALGLMPAATTAPARR